MGRPVSKASNVEFKRERGPICRLGDRDAEHVAAVRVVRDAEVVRAQTGSVDALAGKHVGVDTEGAGRGEADGRDVLHADGPVPHGDLAAGQDADFVSGLRGGVDVEAVVCAACRRDAHARHVLVVVPVHGVFGGRQVRGGGVVGGVGLGQQVGHQVVQLIAAAPVAAQADGVVALQAGDPPRGAGGDLFLGRAVFVDVVHADGQAVLGQHRVQGRVGDCQIVGLRSR